MATRNTALVATLAEIDQLLAKANELGGDASLKLPDFLTVCDCIGSFEQLRRDVESELRVD
jgi:hypothetical protein